MIVHKTTQQTLPPLGLRSPRFLSVLLMTLGFGVCVLGTAPAGALNLRKHHLTKGEAEATQHKAQLEAQVTALRQEVEALRLQTVQERQDVETKIAAADQILQKQKADLAIADRMFLEQGLTKKALAYRADVLQEKERDQAEDLPAMLFQAIGEKIHDVEALALERRRGGMPEQKD